MNTRLGAWFSGRLGAATMAAALLVVSVVSHAQSNTAYGDDSLHSNTTGSDNAAFGFGALFSNTTGSENTAIGYDALFSNVGSDNTANGYAALYTNTTGYYNTADGFGALYTNTTGYFNAAIGWDALYSNTTGINNIALGYQAGYNLTTGNNNIELGNSGTSSNSGVIRIGAQGAQHSTFIAGISGVTASGGVEVFVNAHGQLGTLKSSRRFKQDIHDMGRVSDKLMKLRPVTFRYKDSAEQGPHPLQYGLIAEEVAKVYPDLVQYDKAGRPFTVYYHLLTPMLINELQKAHRQAEAQKGEIAALKSALSQQNSELAAVKEQQRQQVSALAKLSALVAASRQSTNAHTTAYVRP